VYTAPTCGMIEAWYEEMTRLSPPERPLEVRRDVRWAPDAAQPLRASRHSRKATDTVHG